MVKQRIDWQTPLRALIILICIGLLVAQIATGRERWQARINGNVIQVEVVASPEEQQLGLGNRFSLPEGQGMLFTYDAPGNRIFWMKRMHFPIDIIWLLNHRIVHIENSVQPPEPDTQDHDLQRYGRGILADLVLEVPAGYTRKHNIKVGQRIEIVIP